jgi:hypothetical protein
VPITTEVRPSPIHAVIRAALAGDRSLAGTLSGLLFMAGGVATVLMLALPGAAGSHDGLAMLAALGAIGYGLTSVTLVPWERLPFAMLHVPGVVSAVTATAVAAWTGGHESPTRLLGAFLIVWSACFCRAWTIAAYVVGCASRCSCSSASRRSR